jgi:uncharacterized membrane protein YhhN
VTTASWILLAATAAVAVLDWIAVARGWARVEYAAKPLTMVGLIGVALAVDPVHSDMRAAFVIALVCSLVGDVFLMLPSDRFVAGLAAFLAAHLAYTAGFVLGPGSVGGFVVGAVITAAVAVPLGIHLVRAVHRSAPAVVTPVVAYTVVISVMVASATGWGNAWAIVGAWLFFASDALIGETRFGRSIPASGLAIIVTYHVGQALLVLSLVHGS